MNKYVSFIQLTNGFVIGYQIGHNNLNDPTALVAMGLCILSAVIILLKNK